MLSLLSLSFTVIVIIIIIITATRAMWYRKAGVKQVVMTAGTEHMAESK